jgi:hypothetical protein
MTRLYLQHHQHHQSLKTPLFVMAVVLPFLPDRILQGTQNFAALKLTKVVLQVRSIFEYHL